MHYLADRAGIRGRFSDADAYHLDRAFPLLMKQLELMLTSGELNPAISIPSRCMQRADLQSRYPQQLWLRLYGCLSDTGTRNHLITPNISPLALPVTENLR